MFLTKYLAFCQIKTWTKEKHDFWNSLWTEINNYNHLKLIIDSRK